MRNGSGNALMARLDAALLYIFLVSAVFVAGRLFLTVGPAASSIGFGLVATSVMAAAGLRFLQLDLPVMAPFALTCGYFVLALYNFGGIFSREVNLNAIGPFVGIMSFVIYYPLIMQGKFGTIARAVLLISSIYSIVYLLLNIAHQSGLSVVNLSGLLIPDAPGGRADRILAASAVLTVGASMWLVRLRNSPTPIAILMTAIFLVDIYLTGSRFYQAAFLLLATIYLFSGKTRVAGAVAILLLAIAASQLIIFALFGLSNPFEIFGSDNSASVRASSVSLAVPYIREHWLMGVGYPSSNLDNVWATSALFFFSSDLGPLGIMYNHGLVGLVLFGLLSYFSALPDRRIDLLPGASLDGQAITLAGAICALQGVLAPVLWVGSGTFLSGLFLALALAFLTQRRVNEGHLVGPRASTLARASTL